MRISCETAACTAACGQDEVLVTAYCGPGRAAVTLINERTASCPPRRPATSPLVANAIRFWRLSSMTRAPPRRVAFATIRSTITEYRSRPPRVRVTGLSAYSGLLGAKNWELIQPFKRVFSTWTQSPSRPVALNCVPLGPVPITGAFPEGPDLMLTPGWSKKTTSGFCAVELVWGVTALAATWGEASAAGEAGTSTTVGAGCTSVSDDDSTRVEEDDSAPVEEDATGTVCAVSAGGFAPGEARKKYASTAAPNAATIAAGEHADKNPPATRPFTDRATSAARIGSGSSDSIPEQLA
jgi:hypothetical protein